MLKQHTEQLCLSEIWLNTSSQGSENWHKAVMILLLTPPWNSTARTDSTPCLSKLEYSLVHGEEHGRLFKGSLITGTRKLCLAMSGMFSYKMPNSLVFFRSKANKTSCELFLFLFLHSKNVECFKNAENMTVVDKTRKDVWRYCAEEILIIFIKQILYWRRSGICNFSQEPGLSFLSQDPCTLCLSPLWKNT